MPKFYDVATRLDKPIQNNYNFIIKGIEEKSNGIKNAQRVPGGGKESF